MARQYIKLAREGATLEELEKMTLGSLRRAVIEGDLETGSFMAGQVAGLVKTIRPVEEIIKSLFEPVEGYRKSLKVL